MILQIIPISKPCLITSQKIFVVSDYFVSNTGSDIQSSRARPKPKLFLRPIRRNRPEQGQKPFKMNLKQLHATGDSRQASSRSAASMQHILTPFKYIYFISTRIQELLYNKLMRSSRNYINYNMSRYPFRATHVAKFRRLNLGISSMCPCKYGSQTNVGVL